MKKLFSLFLLCGICIACSNHGKGNLNDRVLVSVSNNDSANREKTIAALGDTVFGTICYGMNKNQFRDAYDKFKQKLNNDGFHDFNLAGYDFGIYGICDLEKCTTKNVLGISYELQDIRTGDFYLTLFFRGQLFAVSWRSNAYGSKEETKSSLNKLVSLFKNRYGEPNIDNVNRFSSSDVETGVWKQMKIIAQWITSNRDITIFYRERVGAGERDESIEERCPYQYDLTVRFLNLCMKKEANRYIDDILLKEQEDLASKRHHDSINETEVL
jgi:hypothetical protein